MLSIDVPTLILMEYAGSLKIVTITSIGTTYRNVMLFVVVNRINVYISANPIATRCLMAAVS